MLIHQSQRFRKRGQSFLSLADCAKRLPQEREIKGSLSHLPSGLRGSQTLVYQGEVFRSLALHNQRPTLQDHSLRYVMADLMLLTECQRGLSPLMDGLHLPAAQRDAGSPA